MTDIKSDNIGVYITSDKAEADPTKKVSKGHKISHEKFGFSELKEVADYIRENMDKDDIFIVYTYEIQFGQQIMRLLSYGSLEDLENMQ